MAADVKLSCRFVAKDRKKKGREKERKEKEKENKLPTLTFCHWGSPWIVGETKHMEQQSRPERCSQVEE